MKLAIYVALVSVLLFLPGVAAIYSAYTEEDDDWTIKDWIEDFKDDLFLDFSALDDKTKTERLLTAFRRDYEAFFKSRGQKENDAIQDEATQITWNIANLQNRRLEKLGVTYDIRA